MIRIWATINVGADRETAIRIQLLEWQIGIANSSGIARNILNETDNLNELHPRNADHNLVRFKLLMGMMVWSHQAVGITYHTHLYGLKERHAIHHDMSDHELEVGLQFSSIVTSNTENEAYAEYTMELYHGYGCHCLPDHAHYIFTGGTGRAQDSIDINCQLLRSCYACEEQANKLCDAHASDYSYNLNRGTSVEGSITCTDPKGSCSRNVCECDKTFAVNAAILYSHKLWTVHHHGINFDRVETCRPHHHGHHPEITHCDRKRIQESEIYDDLNDHHDTHEHSHVGHHTHDHHHHHPRPTQRPSHIHVNHEAEIEHNHRESTLHVNDDGKIEFNPDAIGHTFG